MKPVYISNIIFLVKTFTANNFLAKLNKRAFSSSIFSSTRGVNKLLCIDLVGYSTNFYRRSFSSFRPSLNEHKNPLALGDGEFGITSDVKMKLKLKWVKTKPTHKKVGYLGVTAGLLDNEYRIDVGVKLGLDFTSLDGLITIERELKLGVINQEKENADVLANIFKTLNPFLSYSAAFIVYQKHDLSFHTVGQHYLVNNTTNSYELMKDVYRKINEIQLRYKFVASDTLIVKL